MKGLLRPWLVGGLTIAIASANLIGPAVLAAVGAAPSTVTATVTPSTVVEGGSVTLDISLDQSATELLALTVDWGDFTMFTGSFVVGQSQQILTHTYTDDFPTPAPQDVLNITVFLDSLTGSRLTGSTRVTVQNAPPTWSSFSVTPSGLVSGQTATAAGSFADAGIADTHTLTIDWGDGTTQPFGPLGARTTTFSFTHTYASCTTCVVRATVVDKDGGSAETSVPITVLSQNVAPTFLAPLSMSPVAEGGTSTLTLSFADADAGDTHTLVVNWGDLSLVETFSAAAGVFLFSPTHKYENTGTFTVNVTLSDSASHSIVGLTSVTPTNVAPTVSLGALGSPAAGETLNVTGTFTDPGKNDTFTVNVDFGDRTSGSATLGPDGHSFSATHAYADPGPYVITARVTDRDGGFGDATGNVVVRPRNTAPSGLVLNSGAIRQGATFTLEGRFTDPDAADAHTVSIDWGDGASASLELGAGTTTFSASHAFSAVGVFKVTVKVSDALASTSMTTTVDVHAPTAAELFDDLVALIRSFRLDPNLEAKVLRRIDELRSEVSQGKIEDACDDFEAVAHLPTSDLRLLSAEQVAALKEIAAKLSAALHCQSQDEQDRNWWGQSHMLKFAAVSALLLGAGTRPPWNRGSHRKDSDKRDTNRSGGRAS